MKKISAIILAAVLMFSLSSAVFADKAQPLKTYDFNAQSKGEIECVSSNGVYFEESFESGIGGREAKDFAYKITAKKQGSQSGSYAYTLTIPTGGESEPIVTAEFDLFSNITANPNAKQSQTPSILLYASDKNILYIKQTAIQSVLESWKSVNSDTSYIGSWAKMALTVNKTAKTADMYMNGVKILNAVSLGSDYTDKAYIKLGWSYWYDAPGDDCFFAVDNIISYAGIMQPDDKITWNNQNGKIGSISDISTGDEISATIDMYNFSGTDKTVTAVFLVRNGAKIVSAKSKRAVVTASEEPTVITADAVEITDTENLDVKYILIDSWENRTPICDAYILK